MTGSLSQTFGIEIECLMPATLSRATLAQALTDAGVPSYDEGYHHMTRAHWKLVHDGSVRGSGVQGVEVVSPVLTGEDGIAQIRKVCDVLVAVGCKVNKTCGLHVHVGARDRDVEFFRRLVSTYAHFEASIDGVLPASRRGNANHYCQSILRHAARAVQKNTVQGMIGAFGGRYFKLNVQSWLRHGTVEFRHHSGTVEAEKAVNWTLLCLAIVHKAATGDASAPQPIVYRGRQVVPSEWPSTQIIVDLMSRPQGATLDELRAATGMQAPGPAFRARLFGYGYRKVTRHGVTRHFAIAPAAVGAATMPEGTLEGLLAHVQAPEAVRTYFVGRRDNFSARS